MFVNHHQFTVQFLNLNRMERLLRLLINHFFVLFSVHIFFSPKDLLDEHAQSIFVQIFNKMLLLLEYFGDNLGREHVLPVLSVFGTIGFIVAIGYLLAYLVRIEEEDIQKKQSTKNNNNNGNIEIENDKITKKKATQRKKKER